MLIKGNHGALWVSHSCQNIIKPFSSRHQVWIFAYLAQLVTGKVHSQFLIESAQHSCGPPEYALPTFTIKTYTLISNKNIEHEWQKEYLFYFNIVAFPSPHHHLDGLGTKLQNPVQVCVMFDTYLVISIIYGLLSLLM